MARYFTPLLFAVFTAYIQYYNQTNHDRKLLVPFVDLLFPADAKDPAALGERSVVLAAVLTMIVLAWAIVDHIRDIRRRRALDEEAG